MQQSMHMKIDMRARNSLSLPQRPKLPGHNPHNLPRKSERAGYLDNNPAPFCPGGPQQTDTP